MIGMYVEKSFSGGIISRYTEFGSNINGEAQMLYMENQAYAQPAATEYETNITNITHINNVIEQNPMVNLRLDLQFTDKMITDAVTNITNTYTRRGMMMERPAVLKKDGGKVYVDKSETYELYRSINAPEKDAAPSTAVQALERTRAALASPPAEAEKVFLSQGRRDESETEKVPREAGDVLKQAKETLSGEKTLLEREKKAAAEEKAAVEHEKKTLDAAKAAFEREKSAPETANLVLEHAKSTADGEKAALEHEKDALTAVKAAVEHEKETLRDTEETVLRETEILKEAAPFTPAEMVAEDSGRGVSVAETEGEPAAAKETKSAETPSLREQDEAAQENGAGERRAAAPSAKERRQPEPASPMEMFYPAEAARQAAEGERAGEPAHVTAEAKPDDAGHTPKEAYAEKRDAPPKEKTEAFAEGRQPSAGPREPEKVSEAQLVYQRAERGTSAAGERGAAGREIAAGPESSPEQREKTGAPKNEREVIGKGSFRPVRRQETAADITYRREAPANAPEAQPHERAQTSRAEPRSAEQTRGPQAVASAEMTLPEEQAPRKSADLSRENFEDFIQKAHRAMARQPAQHEEQPRAQMRQKPQAENAESAAGEIIPPRLEQFPAVSRKKLLRLGRAQQGRLMPTALRGSAEMVQRQDAQTRRGEAYGDTARAGSVEQPGIQRGAPRRESYVPDMAELAYIVRKGGVMTAEPSRPRAADVEYAGSTVRREAAPIYATDMVHRASGQVSVEQALAAAGIATEHKKEIKKTTNTVTEKTVTKNEAINAPGKNPLPVTQASVEEAVDINKLTDKVYRALEARIRAEKMRRGL